MADESVQLKTLQTILIIFQSRLQPENEGNMAQALGICLRLLENNRSSDSVRNTAAATFRQAVALIFDHVVSAESLPAGKLGSGGYISRSSSVTSDINRSINRAEYGISHYYTCSSGVLHKLLSSLTWHEVVDKFAQLTRSLNRSLEHDFISGGPSLMRETLTKAGKLGLRLLEDLTALAAGGSAIWLRVSNIQRTFALDILEKSFSKLVMEDGKYVLNMLDLQVYTVELCGCLQNLGFIRTARKVSYGIRDPLILEAIAAREGLLFAKELGLQKVIVEGDAKLVVDMFNRKIKTQTMITVILEDMRQFFSSFEEVLMQFVKCTANGAADCVARHAFGGNGVLRHQICSLLMTSLRTNAELEGEAGEPYFRRLVLRSVAHIIRLYSSSLITECEVFLSMLVKVISLDLPLWHRILVLEVLRGFCVEARTMRILFQNFDMNPKNTNVVDGMVKALARVVSSVQVQDTSEESLAAVAGMFSSKAKGCYAPRDVGFISFLPLGMPRWPAIRQGPGIGWTSERRDWIPGMGMHAMKARVKSDTSTVYSISLYESTITTRDEPWFGELKLACARAYANRSHRFGSCSSAISGCAMGEYQTLGCLMVTPHAYFTPLVAGIEWSLDNDASNTAVLVASEAHAITLAIEGLLGVVFTVATLTDEAVDVGELESPRCDSDPTAKCTGETAVLCMSMVDSMWLTILDALSLILSKSQGEAIVLEILKGYQAFTQACGVLRAVEPLNSFLASLCKFTINIPSDPDKRSSSQSPGLKRSEHLVDQRDGVVLTPKNVQVLETLAALDRAIHSPHATTQEISAAVPKFTRESSGQYSDFSILSSLNSQLFESSALMQISAVKSLLSALCQLSHQCVTEDVSGVGQASSQKIGSISFSVERIISILVNNLHRVEPLWDQVVGHFLELADNSNQHLRNKAFDALDQSICAVLGSDQFQENAAFRLHVESCDVRIVYSLA
ncbi:hypothetical protein RHMOL_Rhmol05G0207500 [Rhododendron molle]|uniref:Uncharacterized protein n=1 Tax=Rhododendron molle TaxID=49168 RepID=A0ACC0NRI7_RHOML|nr:hypothetical protein RHMOL_Rhmol05G0207500 [Rhododendron molle]